MQKLMMAIMFTLSATAVQAQDIAGTWQGTLSGGGKEMRIVFRITSEAGGFRAQGFSIDQGGQPIPVSVAQDGAVVKLTIVAIGGAFEGRLGTDGTTLTGTFTQGNQNTSLTLRKATPETAWPIPNAPTPLRAMDSSFSPSFEVATIKPSDPNQPGQAFRVRGRTFDTLNTTLRDLLTFAYGVHPGQLVGLPKWAEEDRYNITAQPDGEGAPNDRQWRGALQKLLAQRFNLKFRRETRELGAYVLTQLSGGNKLNKSGGDPNGLPGMFFKGAGVLPVINATMGDFAGLLQAVVLDRPVVDRTGLTGRFDFTLQWTPDESQFGGRGGQMAAQLQAGGADNRPGLFTAMQEQLGLRLESTRTAVEVLAIETAERPSEN
jgi:uncharacterized protein (TIGR03435 family)